jgi:hypothetical protein
MSVEIDEKEFLITLKVKNFSVVVVNLELNVKCDLIVSMFDENKEPLIQKKITLEGDDYLNWGENDDYIVDYVCSQYGFTKSLQI